MPAPSPPLPPPCALETMNNHQGGAPPGCPGLASNPNSICVAVKSLKGSAQFALPQETPIQQFKEELAKHFQCEACQLVLVFFGRILRDRRSLRQCGVSDGATVHLVIRSPKRDPGDSTPSSYMPRTSGCAPAPTGTSLALPALNPISQGAWAPPERTPSSLEWPQMPTSEMVLQKVRQLILASPEIQQLAQQFPAICHLLNNLAVVRVILDKMREAMDLARSPETEQELKSPEPLLMSLQSNIPGGDNPLRQLHSDAGQELLASPSPYAALARSPSCPEPEASGGEGAGSQGSGSVPVARSCTNSSSKEGGGVSSSRPAPLGSPLPGLGPSPGAGPCGVGGIQALIVNLCSAYAQRTMLSLMQDALLASEGTPAGPRDQVQQRLQSFYRQMQRPAMVAALSKPKAIQAWVQMEQGLQVLMEEAPVLLPWFVLRLKGLGPLAATGAVAMGSPSEERAALE